MALIDAEPRMATARAVAETVVTIIPSKDLKVRLDRLEKIDPVMRPLVGMFVQRMRDARIISMDS
jgi:CRP-like cAMP-binding protein